MTSGQAERIVGIVDPNWMDSRVGPDRNGVTWCGSSRVFVLDGQWTTVGHEIGHTLQFSHPGDPPDRQCALSPGIGSTEGFWVEQGIEIQGVAPLMGPGSAIPPTFPQPNRWIARDDYERVFADRFRVSPADPEILLISGIIYRDGRIELGPSYRLPSGIVDEADPGEFSIQVLDIEGGVLFEMSFGVEFRLATDPPIETDAVPFGFAVPYPDEAVKIQIQQNDRVLAEVPVTTTLLRDAVESIPDAGFVKNPEQRKNTLLNKIDALNTQLEAGDLTGARNKLEMDIRKHLVDWLIEDYPTQTVLEYTKTAILELVDELLQRLEE